MFIMCLVIPTDSIKIDSDNCVINIESLIVCLQVTMLEPQIAKVRPGQAPPNPNFTPQSHVTWSLELQPNESKQVTVRYTVEYPRNKQVEGL